MLSAAFVVRPFVARAVLLVVITTSIKSLGWSIIGMLSAAFIVRPFVARAVLLVGVTRLLGWSIVAIVAAP
jgi:hypothetical protein